MTRTSQTSSPTSKAQAVHRRQKVPRSSVIKHLKHLEQRLKFLQTPAQRNLWLVSRKARAAAEKKAATTEHVFKAPSAVLRSGQEVQDDSQESSRSTNTSDDGDSNAATSMSSAPQEPDLVIVPPAIASQIRELRKKKLQHQARCQQLGSKVKILEAKRLRLTKAMQATRRKAHALRRRNDWLKP
eukprot:m.46735 g.46735  ORF g.46735 m.46735 type:complete len:185 (+) comp13171_c0_seq2:44-598(+)